MERQYQALCESWRVELEEKQRQFEQVKAQILGPRCADRMCTHCDLSECVCKCFLLKHRCLVHAHLVVGQGVCRVLLFELAL